MKQVGLYKLVACIALLAASCVNAMEVVEPPKVELEKTENTVSFNALQAYWVFSGIVTNESGERYNYYFQMQRKDNKLHAVATLIDGQNKEILLFEENNAVIKQPESGNWQAGRAFMQFNPINNSWVFGVKAKAKIGFNFKVDMLRQTVTVPPTQDLRSGVQLLVNQTGRLNGHLQTGALAKEQFVTAPKAWFKQMWVSKPQNSTHPLTGVLCQFNDGSGFYAVNLQESDALRGAVAGWRDIAGVPMSMSQFVSIKNTEEGQWRIQIPSPKIRLALKDALAKGSEHHQLIAGQTDALMPGFCTISKDEVAQQVQIGALVQK